MNRSIGPNERLLLILGYSKSPQLERGDIRLGFQDLGKASTGGIASRGGSREERAGTHGGGVGACMCWGRRFLSWAWAWALG
jgi:hypothetical protein